MARADDIGFFWTDLPPVKPPKKVKEKKTPPVRTWESPDYLPGLDEALAFNIDVFSDMELLAIRGDEMVFDIECYPNYFLSAFQHIKTGRITYVEMYEGCPLNIEKFRWILENFCIITFYGKNYDMPIAAIALAGKSTATLWFATTQLIELKMRQQDVLRAHKVKKIRDAPYTEKGVDYPRRVNHIDLIEVAKGDCSLKIYAGRIHAPRMQDLPFKPGTTLSMNQIAIVRWYCVNDLVNTGLLRNSLVEQLSLRETLTTEYGVDVRSKSDAQIAETLISQMVRHLNRAYPEIPKIPEGTIYRYQVPSFIKFDSALLQWTLEVVRNADFAIGPSGSPILPKSIKDLNLNIAGKYYQMGFGGLHSQEECIAHFASDKVLIRDWDVASFYPRIILNQKIYPLHLGPNFLIAYEGFVTRRLAAKKAGQKPIAESLKIVVNGGFGKLGSMYSILFSPDLMIQVTLTGQLVLLMLIERLEMVGLSVLSANTDGIVTACPVERKEEMEAIIKGWERDTNFEMEETNYKAIYNANVNNYIAIKLDGTTKNKGWYNNPWSDNKNPALRLEKNPTNTICVEAVTEFLTKQIPIEKTIRMCDDISKFVTVRKVVGGAVKDGEYLGGSIRWYYAKDVAGEIIYARSGNNVPKSTGAKPLMNLPNLMPADVDYDWYLAETKAILETIGATSGVNDGNSRNLEHCTTSDSDS